MEFQRRLVLCLLSSALGACAGGGGSDASDSADGTSEAGCPEAGVESCPCIQGGLCVGELICVSDVCVDLTGLEDEGSTDEGESGPKPDLPSGDGDGDGDGDGSCVGACGGLGSSGDCWCDASCVAAEDCCSDFEAACPGVCVTNADCAADEVCSYGSGGCVDADGWTYDLYIDRWIDSSPDCWDSLAGDCLAEAYFKVYVNGTELFDGPYAPETADTSWLESATITIPTDVSFVVSFYDYDSLSADDFMHRWCFENSSGSCWAVPLEVLHAGSWAGYADDNDYFWVEARFVPQ